MAYYGNVITVCIRDSFCAKSIMGVAVNYGSDGFIADLSDQLYDLLSLLNIITRIINNQPFLTFYYCLIAPVVTYQRPDAIGDFHSVRLSGLGQAYSVHHGCVDHSTIGQLGNLNLFTVVNTLRVGEIVGKCRTGKCQNEDAKVNIKSYTHNLISCYM